MKWLHTLGSIVISGLVIGAPAFQGVIAAHPALAAGIAAVYAIIGHLLPSPVTPGPVIASKH